MKYLITYDIENDKRRKKVSEELEGYGTRVNYSVFECEFNRTKLNKLLKKLDEIVDDKSDSLRFYHICKNCIPKSFEICKRANIFEEESLYI